MCMADEAIGLPLHPSMCSPKLKTSLAIEQRPRLNISGAAHPSVPMFETGKEVLDIVRARPTSAILAVMLPASRTLPDLMSKWRMLACKAAAAPPWGNNSFLLAVGRSCLVELCSQPWTTKLRELCKRTCGGAC